MYSIPEATLSSSSTNSGNEEKHMPRSGAGEPLPGLVNSIGESDTGDWMSSALPFVSTEW